MKTQNNTLLQSLNKAEMDHLVKEVKETVAAGIHTGNQKTVFAVADYWNLRRGRRVRTGRRFLLA